VRRGGNGETETMSRARCALSRAYDRMSSLAIMVERFAYKSLRFLRSRPANSNRLSNPSS